MSQAAVAVQSKLDNFTPVHTKLFMRVKEFCNTFGSPYQTTLEWIDQGMPVMPYHTNPYLIIVPAALEWLEKKYGFTLR